MIADALMPLVNQEVFNADVIIGKIANDKTNPTITAYLNGLYGEPASDMAVNFAIRQLMPEHLKDQICFRSEKAINCLEFKESKKYVIR